MSQKKVGSQKTSNCSNSLNFEAKIKCNTIKPNVPKWRKTCTGLKFDLLNFYGPQSNIHTVSFSKVVLSQGAVNQVFLGVFLMFLAVFHSKIWAQFHFGTFKPYK